MKRIYLYLTLLFPLFVCPSCYYYGDYGPKNPWTEMDIEIKGSIIDVHNTSEELYIITKEHFYRINQDEELVEKRTLIFPEFFFADEVIGDHAFVRFVKKNNREVIEFNLTKNPEIIQYLYVDEIPVRDGVNININFDVAVRASALNDNSDQLALFIEHNEAGVGSNMGALIIDIEYNENKDNFQSITTRSVVSMPELGAERNTTLNFRYLDGFYYLAHHHGGIRLHPNGTYSKIFNGWTSDVFKNGESTYLTSFTDNTFSISNNNGANFETNSFPSPTRYVKQTSGRDFNQTNKGSRPKLVSEDLQSLEEIVFNEYIDQRTDNGAYRDIVYFNGKYYLSFQDKLFNIEEIVTQ